MPQIPSFPTKLFSFQGETSFPYLSGYTWVDFCDWKMLNMDYGSGPARFNPELVGIGDTVFIDYNCLEDFGKRILPTIEEKFILVTSNYGSGADNPMPGPFAYLMENPKIATWLVQNIEREPSDKLLPIPIGIANKCWPHGDTELLDRFIPLSLSNKERPIFCYANYTVHANRENTTDHFRKIGAHFARRDTFEEYLQDLSESLFVVSPPGNGVDCHRTWEALLMGCYPIVKSSYLNSLYEGLPVVIIEDWEEVTESFLKKKHEEFKSQTWSREKLYAPFWFQRIKNIASKLLTLNE
jgi:hypothetical protein